jgi:murein DD-endopeptidase MepM/ murein hydrolase activator NlpD
MASDYWNQRNEIFVKSFQTLAGIPADGLAGEQTFTALDPRSWPMRNLPDGRQFFVTNAFDPVKHKGIDIFASWQDGDQLVEGYWTPYAGGKVWYPFGSQSVAACAGTVKRSELIGTGWLITIEHVNGDTTGYFHGREGTALVTVGQQVERGQALFFCGWSIASPGPSENNVVHLHFSVQRDGAYLDPEDWLKYADYLPALVCDDETANAREAGLETISKISSPLVTGDNG